MKMLCINNKLIIAKGKNGNPVECTGDGLIEESVYETYGEPYIGLEHNLPLIYIKGLGSRLACRFTRYIEEEKTHFIYKKEIQLN